MRTVSFVDHLEFDVGDTVGSKAMAVGDVDNDQACELAVGKTNGQLFIFKGKNSKPWREASDLGMITCVEVGDVFNYGINYLMSCSVEGWCNVFAVKPDSATPENGEDNHILKPVHKQHLVANCKVILLADINGDGKKELLIGFSDRRVRAYRWRESPAETLSPGGQLTGTFEHIESWKLEGQLSSMTLHTHQGGRSELMVSQPGGAFVSLLSAQQNNSNSVPIPRGQLDDSSDLKPKTESSTFLNGPSVIYHPLGTSRARNPEVTTEVLGNIQCQKSDEETHMPSYYAICTLDGTLSLVDDDKILWSLCVDHQLFMLSKLDVTGNGSEEVIACSLDGQTYIVNLHQDVIRFPFREHVSAFQAGHYAVAGAENVPCFIYATFSNRIIVYYNIHMEDVGCTNLIEKMKVQEEIANLLNYYNVDATRPKELQQLYHWSLYGGQSS